MGDRGLSHQQGRRLRNAADLWARNRRLSVPPARRFKHRHFGKFTITFHVLKLQIHPNASEISSKLHYNASNRLKAQKNVIFNQKINNNIIKKGDVWNVCSRLHQITLIGAESASKWTNRVIPDTSGAAPDHPLPPYVWKTEFSGQMLMIFLLKMMIFWGFERFRGLEMSLERVLALFWCILTFKWSKNTSEILKILIFKRLPPASSRNAPIPCRRHPPKCSCWTENDGK